RGGGLRWRLPRPQGETALAGQPPAAAAGPTATASPVPGQPAEAAAGPTATASPLPGQPPTRPVSAGSSPPAPVTAHAPAASGVTPAPSISSASTAPHRSRRPL